MISAPFGDKFSSLTLQGHDGNLHHHQHSKTPTSVTHGVHCVREGEAKIERVCLKLRTFPLSFRSSSILTPQSTILFFQVMCACPFIIYIEGLKTFQFFRGREKKMWLICRQEGSRYEDGGERGGGTASCVFKISSLRQMTQFHTYCPRKSSQFSIMAPTFICQALLNLLE